MNAKSYEVRFGINSSEVAQQLANLDKSLRETNGYVKMAQTSLKNGWDASTWVDAQKKATKAAKESTEKVELLKKQLKELETGGLTTEKEQAQFASLQREIVAATNAAAKAQKALEDINTIRLDATRKQLQQVSDTLQSIGNKMMLGVTLPLVAAGSAAVSSAADMEESTSKVEVVFGNAADFVKSFADETLQSYGIAKSTALEMTSLFGDMATSMGFSEDEAADLSKTLVALAGDLASFKNMSLDEVKTALLGTFSGETESLKRLGVVMTQTNLEAYALSLGINKNIADMSEYEKVQLRVQYVLDKTSNASGDFARTSDSTANQMRILTESLKELSATAGNELTPMITPIIKSLNDLLQKIGNLDDGTKKAITQAALFAATLGPLLSITGKMTGGVAAAVTAYRNYKVAADAAKVSQAGLNAAQAASPAGLIAGAISVLVSVLGSYAISSALASSNTETFADKLQTTKQSLDDINKSVEENANEQKAELAVLEDQVKRYEELNGKVGDDADKKAELAKIVNDLNAEFDDCIKTIDEETGKYQGNTTAIRENIKARQDMIEAQAYEEQALNTRKAMVDIETEINNKYGIDIDAARAYIDFYNRQYSDLIKDSSDWTDGSWWDNLIGDFKIDYYPKDAVDAKLKADDLKKALKDYDEYKKEYEDILGKATSYGEYTSSGTSSGSEDYKQLAKDIEYDYKSGANGIQTYIKRLTDYRDKYLVKDSDEWRSYTLKIKDLREQAQKDADKSAETAAKKATDNRKEQIAAAANDIEYAYNSGAIQIDEYIVRLTKYRDEYLTSDIEQWRSYTLKIKSLTEQAEKEKTEQRKAAIAAEEADFEYAYSAGEISLAEYIAKLTAYRDKYFEDDIDGWRSYTLKIKSLIEELAEEEQRAQEKRLEEAKEATETIIGYAEQEADAKIAAIDAELAARKKLKEDQSLEIKMQQALAELAFTRDEDSRLSLEREIASLREQMEERAIEDQAEIDKEAIRADLAALKTQVQEQMTIAQQQIAPVEENPYLKNITPNITVNAQGLTVEQARQLVKEVYNDIMYGAV